MDEIKGVGKNVSDTIEQTLVHGSGADFNQQNAIKFKK